MPRRPRHPRKELEALLKELEVQGWRVDKKKRYYRARCPCGNCQYSINLTPSGANYRINKRNRMTKCPMWNDED